jgi:hypothetical protein
LPSHWFEYFLARLFSQAGLESLDVICVPRNSWGGNGCNALHCSLPLHEWKLIKQKGLPPRKTSRQPVTPFYCAVAVRMRTVSSPWICTPRYIRAGIKVLRVHGLPCQPRGPHSSTCYVRFCWLFFFHGGTGVCTCKAGALTLEPHLQFILLWLFLEMGVLKTTLSGLKP